ncbi:MAG: copper amine oxidase N-terminal domain-containing protein, partial [Clostridia bacterium]|nr:copper amine oxidase N-terminal domain-containing protein [Clostridia bacterium]
MKTMKKILLLLTFLCLLPMFSTTEKVHAEQNVTVLFNGSPMQFDVPPVILNGRTMVPLRAIFEALDAEVSWDDASETAIGVRRGVRVSVTVDSAA